MKSFRVFSPACLVTHAILTHTRMRTRQRQEHQEHKTTKRTDVLRVLARVVWLCRVHGVVTRTTRSRRVAKVMRHQSNARCSALCGSRFSPGGDHETRFSHNCFFQIHLDLRQLPLCLVRSCVKFQVICKGLPELLFVASTWGCWSTSIAADNSGEAATEQQQQQQQQRNSNRRAAEQHNSSS